MSQPQNVLWTGGWDSTFRIVQLLQKGLTVQPYYILDKERPSTAKEILTMELLTKKIIEKYHLSQPLLLKTIFINKKDIPKKLVNKIAHKVLKRQKHLGSQYYWLSCLSSEIKNLELSVHCDDFFFLKGKMTVKENEEIGSFYELNKEVSSFWLRTIFGELRYPIIGLKKLDMKKLAEEGGFMDIMDITWFCHQSTSKPCGHCNPCKQLVRDGMGYRISA